MRPPNEDGNDVIPDLSYDEALQIVNAPTTQQVGSDDWHHDTIRRIHALHIVLLSDQIGKRDRQKAETLLDFNKFALTEISQRRDWDQEMKLRTDELRWENEFRSLNFKYADAAHALAEAQLQLGRQTKEASDSLGRSLAKATWVLAVATIVLAASTIALFIVTAQGI